MDGAHGNVPGLTACRERGLPFVTRLNRPHLLTEPHVLAVLRESCWTRVPDSGCGPQRSAVDLGALTLHAGKDTFRPDGSGYEPIDVRVVAVIFEKKGPAKRGRVLDGHEVELFAVDLPADAWPAPEAIAAYYGRNAIENRFAQEDRELGIDRIISYHLPGQELATVVALSVWNDQLVRGFQLHRPPDTRPLQAPRQVVVDDSIPETWPCDPVVKELLDSLDWPNLLARRPGWSFDDTTGEITCEDGRPLGLTTVRSRPRTSSTTSLIFRRPAGGCENCGSRSHCLHSERPLASKHLEVSVPTDVAERLRKRLGQLRQRPPRTPITPIEASSGPRAEEFDPPPDEGCLPRAEALETTRAGDRFRSFDLEVPVDYDDPAGTKHMMQGVVRYATGDRIGPLVVNPGGPEGSAEGLARFLAARMPDIAERFDIIGLDPRLTGGNSPLLDCMDEFDPVWDTVNAVDGPELDAWQAAYRAWLDECQRVGGPVTDFMGARELVRDHEVLREYFDCDPYTIVGLSWGTAFGQLYAELFPEAIRAAYLDGVSSPPGAPFLQVLEDSALGLQSAFDDFSDWCLGDDSCDLTKPQTQVEDLLEQVKATPISTTSGRDLTFRRAWTGIASLLPEPSNRARLSSELVQALDGDGDALAETGDAYYSYSTSAGDYVDPWIGAYYFTRCSDGSIAPEAEVFAAIRDLENEATFFAGLLDTAITCIGSDIPNEPEIGFVSASDAPTILLVGGAADPLIPFVAAERVHAALDDSVLLESTQPGHIGLFRSDCVDDAFRDYVLDLELPSTLVCD